MEGEVVRPGMVPRLAILILVSVAFGVASESAAPLPRTVEVVFVRDTRLVRVERTVPVGVPPARFALRELLRGPSPTERALGLRTAIGEGSRLRALRSRDGSWAVSLSRSFFEQATSATIETRLRQLTATLAPLAEHRYVAVAAEGRLATTIRVGAPPAPWRPRSGEQAYRYTVRGLQLRLWTLGYLDRTAVTGRLDDETAHALLAFQGWEGLVRTGTVTGQTQLALLDARRPVPSTRADRLRIEIHRDRGILLVARGREVIRAVHTSTGAFGRTPAGTFRVYRKERLSWSVPFQVWMPYAAYFDGGIAMHEYPIVPAYPASHGCVRLPRREAERVYRLVDVGTPVVVV